MLHVDSEQCRGCGACANVCPVGAIQMIDHVAVINQDTCRQCQMCVSACPVNAIVVDDSVGLGMRRMSRNRGMGRGMGNG